MRILVAGATGFVGSAIVRRLTVDGHKVIALSRDPKRADWPAGVEAMAWDGRSPLQMPAVDAVVHAAGTNIAQRWTAQRKKEFHDSRVGVAKLLVDAIADLPPERRPSAFVAVSAVGYYGLRPEGPQDEQSPPGDDFLAKLCVDWEKAVQRAGDLGLRVVVLRMGIVLHPEGGALKRMLLPFRLGLGGPLGKGDQPFPWVHRDDVAGAFHWALTHEQAKGAYNLCAPDEVDMRTFADQLGMALGRPVFLRVPAFALRAAFGQGAADVLLGGQRPSPRRIERDGFKFQHTELGPALRDLVGGARAP